MRDRGKAVESSTTLLISDNFSSDPSCRKHPSSSSVGICAYCLKDRLIKLVCSDCGEQRLSSCSCSDISSNRNSCSVEVGSVGRISFLIENEKTTDQAPAAESNYSKVPFLSSSTNSKQSSDKAEPAAVLLKRNSSCSAYEKRRAFWHVGWLFRKRKNMGFNVLGRNSSAAKEDGESLPFEHGDLSETRICFDGEMRAGSESVKTSDFDDGKQARFVDLKAGLSSESKRGFSGPRNSSFVGLESAFTSENEAGFIDLEVDFLSKSKGANGTCQSSFKAADVSQIGGLPRMPTLGRFSSLRGGLLERESDLKSDFIALQRNGFGNLRSCSLEHEPGSLGHFTSDASLSNGSSCRITVNDCEIRGKKGFKVWKWIFKNSKGRSGRNRMN